MKQGSTILLRLVIIFIGLAALAFCGVLIYGIMTDRTGYYRPILIGMFVPAVPFFVALYQAFLLLNLIDHNKAFSNLSVLALKRIKYCAAAISLMYMAGMPFIFSAADKDDAPGVVLIGLIVICASFVVAVFAAVLQKLVHTAIEIKSENDLTV